MTTLDLLTRARLFIAGTDCTQDPEREEEQDALLLDLLQAIEDELGPLTGDMGVSDD